MPTPKISVLAAGLALCAAAAAQGTPAEVFDRYLAAVHAGDMAAVRALIAPDVERSDFPGCRLEMDNPACLAHDLDATVVRPQARLTLLRADTGGERITAFRFVPDFADVPTTTFFATLGIGPRASQAPTK